MAETTVSKTSTSASMSAERVNGSGLLKAFVFALIPAAVINIVLWVAAQAMGVDFKGIAWPMIVIANAVVLVIAAVVLMVLGRLSPPAVARLHRPGCDLPDLVRTATHRRNAECDADVDRRIAAQRGDCPGNHASGQRRIRHLGIPPLCARVKACVGVLNGGS